MDDFSCMIKTYRELEPYLDIAIMESKAYLKRIFQHNHLIGKSYLESKTDIF